jgi:hypothetical protein
MKTIKLKTLLCVAGVLGVSALGVSVQAQGTRLLETDPNNLDHLNETEFISTYTFSGPMIVNSIGFYTGGASPLSFSWSRTGDSYSNITGQSYTESNGFRWYTVNESFTSPSFLKVKTNFASGTNLITMTSQTSGLNVNLTSVTANGVETLGGVDDLINTNIRVSNPGLNVAPEPGTFALALTGGAALAGVGLRRRRKLG